MRGFRGGAAIYCNRLIQSGSTFSDFSSMAVVVGGPPLDAALLGTKDVQRLKAMLQHSKPRPQTVEISIEICGG